MQRRNFIKSSVCLSCIGLIGCSKINYTSFFNGDNIKNFDHTKSKFFYKNENELPKKLRIEGCSLCQLNCVKCGVRKLEKRMPKNWLGYLKFKDFKKFIDAHSFIEEIDLTDKGELFLNPELDEIIKYAYKKNVKLTANAGTNFNTVSDTTLENLVKYKFQSIKIAIDGATPKTYSKYRRGGNFDTVISNIKKINSYKTKHNSEYPKLYWQFILFGHNEHEIEKAKKMAKDLNMKILFFKNGVPTYSPLKNPKLALSQAGIPLDEEKEMLKPCYAFFHTPQIDHSGLLYGCCFRKIMSFEVNVFKKGLLNALNSPNVIYAKEMLTNYAVSPIDNVPCSECPEYKYAKKNNYTFPLDYVRIEEI